MKPLVFTYDWDRLRLWDEARARIDCICKAWDMPFPVIVNGPSPRPGFWKAFGMFAAPNLIYVNVPRATAPSRVRGRNWSYPGHKSDRTCAGVLAHEFGHYAQYRLQLRHRPAFSSGWRVLAKATAPVTGYEPLPSEAWAETMRIYIWNPDLLYRARLERFRFISKYVPPLHSLSWRDVLCNAPAHIVQAADRFARTREAVRCPSL